MNELTIKALVEAGAIKKIQVVADASHFYVEVETPSGSATASTIKGAVKTWASLDAVAKWLRRMGIGSSINLNISRWQPGQRRILL